MIRQRQPEKYINEVVSAKSSPVNIDLLIKHLMSAFGGLESFANVVVTQWTELPDKSPSRQRLISDIMRLIATSKVQGPAVDATQDEIRHELQQIMQADENGKNDQQEEEMP